MLLTVRLARRSRSVARPPRPPPPRHSWSRAANKLGKDVEVAPKKTYVSLRRNKQFAIVQPTTKTRVDLGLNLSDVDTSDRLEAAGSWNSMCSHRIRLTSADEVDEQVSQWLAQAYEQN